MQNLHEVDIQKHNLAPEDVNVKVQGHMVKINAEKKVNITQNPIPDVCRLDKRIERSQTWDWERTFEERPEEITAQIQNGKLKVEFILNPVPQQEIQISTILKDEL